MAWLAAIALCAWGLTAAVGPTAAKAQEWSGGGMTAAPRSRSAPLPSVLQIAAAPAVPGQGDAAAPAAPLAPVAPIAPVAPPAAVAPPAGPLALPPGVAPPAARPDAFIAEILEPDSKMQVVLHRSKLVRTKAPVTRFSVTQPEVLDVVQYSPAEFELIGLKKGQTSLTLWFGERALRYLVTVEAEPGEREQAITEYRELQAKINEMFPNSMVQLIPFADKLIIRGQVRDSTEATQILALLSGGHHNYQGLGRFNFDVGVAAKPHAGTSDLPARHLINLLDVPGEKQVLLKVRIAELSRSALRQMSVDLSGTTGHVNFMSTAGLSAIFSSVLNPEDLALALQAATTNTYSKILAEPNLVTLNGQPATSFVGGEFAVPTVVGFGGVSGVNTQFRSFGTTLLFTPTILDKDRIRLAVAPSISSLNADNTVDGIPGLNSQSVTTTVDLREGQWLAIAGLLQEQLQGSKTATPLVGDLPLIGTFFSNRRVKRDELELVVLVSPSLVHPLDAQETPLVLPGMEITEPSDLGFWLGGAYVGKSDCDPRAMLAPPRHAAGEHADARALSEAMSRPAFQRSEKYYVYGPHGLSR
jgi:pilus assembly protein CpaC